MRQRLRKWYSKRPRDLLISRMIFCFMSYAFGQQTILHLTCCYPRYNTLNAHVSALFLGADSPDGQSGGLVIN